MENKPKRWQTAWCFYKIQNALEIYRHVENKAKEAGPEVGGGRKMTILWVPLGSEFTTKNKCWNRLGREGVEGRLICTLRRGGGRWHTWLQGLLACCTHLSRWFFWRKCIASHQALGQVWPKKILSLELFLELSHCYLGILIGSRMCTQHALSELKKARCLEWWWRFGDGSWWWLCRAVNVMLLNHTLKSGLNGHEKLVIHKNCWIIKKFLTLSALELTQLDMNCVVFRGLFSESQPNGL